jgi:hypothetical protein
VGAAATWRAATWRLTWAEEGSPSRRDTAKTSNREWYVTWNDGLSRAATSSCMAAESTLLITIRVALGEMDATTHQGRCGRVAVWCAARARGD